MSKKKSQTVRFAVGTETDWWSSVWRMVVAKNEVYIGSGKQAMGTTKISLHSSGVWTFAGTSQSGLNIRGNRRLNRWQRPDPMRTGLVRGPSICVPFTSFGSRLTELAELGKPITWIAAPLQDQAICFDVYFLDPGTTVKWTNAERTVAEMPLTNGTRVQLVSFRRAIAGPFSDGVETHLRGLRMRTDAPGGKMRGSLTWVVDSDDKPPVHVVIDAPIPWGPQLSPIEAARLGVPHEDNHR